MIDHRGDRWLARVFYRDPASGRKRETGKTFKRRKDAEAWERETERAQERGEWVRPSTLTLGEHFENWLRGAGGASLRPRTAEDYRQKFDLYVRASLGHARLSELTPALIEREYITLVTEGALQRQPDSVGPRTGRALSPRTVHYAHAILRKALESAVRDRILLANPAASVELPRHCLGTPARKALARGTLTFTEVARLLATAEREENQEGNRCYTIPAALIRLLLDAGLRPSEALGLKWVDLDLRPSANVQSARDKNARKVEATGLVMVRRALVPVKKWADQTGAGWRLDSPKTAKSIRTIPIADPRTVEALLRHRDRQEADKLVAMRVDGSGDAASQFNDHGFVFTKPNGEPLREDTVHKAFQRVSRLAGIEKHVVLYSTRHTCATLAQEEGAPLPVIQQRLGHSSIKVTADTYTHVNPDFQRNALTRFARKLCGNRSRITNEPTDTRG